MIVNNTIQSLKHDEVDKDRYDECIIEAENSLIYARSFYLDNMCPTWEALVADDYSWVMPITKNKKWGIKYLYQPPLMQQLGVFNLPWATVPINDIMDVLKQQYSFWQVNFNYSMQLQARSKKLSINNRTNYILPLNTSYPNLSRQYHKDLVKNLKKSNKYNLIYQSSDDYLNAIDTYITHYSDRIPHVTTSDYNNFKVVCKVADGKGMIVCRKVVNDKNELLATVLLLKDERRLYNIMNATTAAGRKVEANHFLLDAVIKEFAGKELLLDFEGSDLRGVKSFYKNFGATNQPYYLVKYNNLPWPINLFK